MWTVVTHGDVQTLHGGRWSWSGERREKETHVHHFSIILSVVVWHLHVTVFGLILAVYVCTYASVILLYTNWCRCPMFSVAETNLQRGCIYSVTPANIIWPLARSQFSTNLTDWIWSPGATACKLNSITYPYLHWLLSSQTHCWRLLLCLI